MPAVWVCKRGGMPSRRVLMPEACVLVMDPLDFYPRGRVNMPSKHGSGILWGGLPPGKAENPRKHGGERSCLP